MRTIPCHRSGDSAPYAPAVDIAAHLDLALELADAADAITMARFRADRPRRSRPSPISRR